MRCWVLGCTTKYEKQKEGEEPIRFYSFPKNAELRATWEAKCQRSITINDPRVCSRHFAKDAYISSLECEPSGVTQGSTYRLANDAVPTLNLPKSSDVQYEHLVEDASTGFEKPTTSLGSTDEHESINNSIKNESSDFFDSDDSTVSAASSTVFYAQPYNFTLHASKSYTSSALSPSSFKVDIGEQDTKEDIAFTEEVNADILEGNDEFRLSISYEADYSYLQPPNTFNVIINENCDTFCCFTCGMVFNGFRNYHRHYRIFHPEMIGNDLENRNKFIVKVPKELACQYCLRVFNKNTYAFHTHMKTTHNDFLYSCPLCSMLFNKQQKRAQHISSHSFTENETKDEAPPEKLICDFCPKVFNCSDALHNHVQGFHMEKSFPCPYCPKISRRKHLMERHMRIHFQRRNANTEKRRTRNRK